MNFPGAWDRKAALDRYENHPEDKDAWLRGFAAEMAKRPAIVGGLYFNRDKTGGLSDFGLTGELDWTAIGANGEKSYAAMAELLAESK